MKKILMPAVILLFIIGTVKAGELATLATGKYIFKPQTVTAKLISSSRLFSMKYDLTSVIMVIPSGTIVNVLGSDSTYFRIRYGEDEGYIYRKEAVITDAPAPVVQEKTITNQPENNQQAETKQVDRKTYLENKYGSAMAGKMLAGKIWKGMNAEMVVDSWGKPYKINRTINAGLTREEWIYKNTWLFIENNTLVEWGPVNNR
jgi:hypothetical protein